MPQEPIRKIETDKAPKAAGPYSQAVSAGDYVFVSGQIPIDPGTGEVLKEGIKSQTELVIRNMEAILSSSGLGLDNVVKVEVFLKDMNDFKQVNEVYETMFTDDVKPARQVIEASKLPKDADIEISCIAHAKNK